MASPKHGSGSAAADDRPSWLGSPAYVDLTGGRHLSGAISCCSATMMTRSFQMKQPNLHSETGTSGPPDAESEKSEARDRLLKAANLPRQERIRALREWHQADRKARLAK